MGDQRLVRRESRSSSNASRRRGMVHFACVCLTVLLAMLTIGRQAEAQKILTTVPVALYGQAIGVNPETHKIYVVSEPGNEVTEIDQQTSVQTVISLGPTSEKSLDGAIRIDPVRNKIYVTNVVNSTLAVIDGTTHVVTSVPTGKYPTSLEINPRTHKIYVVNSGSDNVTVVDASSLKTNTIAVGSFPSNVAINWKTNTVYVTNAQSNNVSIIHGRKNRVQTVEAGNNPVPVAVNQATNEAYVGNLAGDTVTVIHGWSKHTQTVKVSPNPFCIVANERTNKVYMNHQAAGSITVIDGRTKKAATIGSGIIGASGPNGLALDKLRNKIYVAEWTTRVTIIDGATGSTSTAVNPGYNTHKIVANPLANEFYTLNMTTNTNNPYSPSSVTVFAGPK
jgi:YVTN family beta-propeller protein